MTNGGLEKLVAADGLRGVTSNPSIFEKAIAESGDYDAALREAEAASDFDVMALYERLAIQDIQQAADVLRPVHEATQEPTAMSAWRSRPISPCDTEATIAEVRRLAKLVGRDNVMIKVPATEAGLPAIRQLIGEGFNINITLLFSQKVYAQVAEAYIAGLEQVLAQGGDPGKIASVASFFVSRIDSAVDKLIDERLGRTEAGAQRAALAKLKGKVAIANAKLAYQHYQRVVQRRTLGEAEGARRASAAAAMGQHQHQEPRLQRRALCRGADRPRYRQHHAAGDHGRVPRPWPRAREPGRGCRAAEQAMAALEAAAFRSRRSPPS